MVAINGEGRPYRLVGMKRCNVCENWLSLSEFHRDNGAKDGLRYCCKECSSVKRKEHYWANRAEAIRRADQWRRENVERSRELALQSYRRRTYGLEPDQYATILDEQGGLCAICGEPETAVNHHGPLSLAVDHNHKTGTVRGMLCRKCNQGIGLFSDNPTRLRMAADYLERANVQLTAP